MSLQSRKNFAAVFGFLGTFSIVLSWSVQSARADKPAKLVERTFVIFANSSENLPDFESEDSLAVIVAPANPKDLP